MGVIELDPRNPSRLYVGTDRIYRTDNRMDSVDASLTAATTSC